MALTIVPLAGPDFHTERFGIRPLHPVQGRPLLEHVLSGRSWLRQPGAREVFVLREAGAATATMRAWLDAHRPQAGVVTLSGLTGGAPLSALAGAALAARPDEPVVVDLADIAFRLELDVERWFEAHPQVDALVPYFASADPKFSYLRLDGPRVLEAREKQVISANASAGVYLFRDVPTFLRAVGFCLAQPAACSVNSVLFVCPSVNGLIGGGREVHALPVADVQPVSTLFHS